MYDCAGFSKAFASQEQRWWFHTGLKAPCLSAHWHSITATGFLAKCCSVVPTGSTDVSLAVAAVAIFLPWQHLHSCVVGCHAQAGTPQPALELLTARGRSAQMAGGGCQGTGNGWRRVAGRDWGSHLASVLALCPGASSTFTRQKACQELEVTLRKALYSLGGWWLGGGGDQTQQCKLISPDSGRKRTGTNWSKDNCLPKF